eukprot:gene25661-31276_t
MEEEKTEIQLKLRPIFYPIASCGLDKGTAFYDCLARLKLWRRCRAPKWKVHGDAKYAYFADRVTWEEAKAACNAIVEEGTPAQLASIFSKGEHDFITETLTRDAESGGSTWLGCTSSADRFNWVGQYDLNG